MVELENGDILLNSRSAAGEKLRKKSVSKDGGASWSPLLDEPGLPEPQCQGSILRFNFPESDQPGRIMFTNPASQNKRVSGTIRLSYDEGETWPVSRLIYNGSFAYSCLTKVNDQTVGLLFEKDNYEKIAFSLIPLNWLEDK
jgi:sialidase-1